MTEKTKQKTILSDSHYPSFFAQNGLVHLPAIRKMREHVRHCRKIVLTCARLKEVVCLSTFLQ